MGTADFQVALIRGEPLADVVVKFRAGVDGVSATVRLNSLADDFDLYPRPWYDDPGSRIGTATRHALERMFGWKLRRVKLPGQSSANPIYWWEEIAPPTRYPQGAQEFIESLGLSQPGADDDGQWYEYP
jgi:hypothetical protein